VEDKLIELIIDKIASKKNISKEEAKLLVDTIRKEDEEIREILNSLNSDITKNIENSPYKNVFITPLLLTQSYNDNRTQRLAENIAIIATALKAINEDSEVKKMLYELKREVDEIKENKYSQLIEELGKTIETVNNYVRSLESKIESVKEPRKVDNIDSVDELLEKLEKLEKLREKLDRLNLVKKEDEKRLSMVATLLGAVASAVLESLTSTKQSSSGNQEEDIRRRFEEWRKKRKK